MQYRWSTHVLSAYVKLGLYSFFCIILRWHRTWKWKPGLLFTLIRCLRLKMNSKYIFGFKWHFTVLDFMINSQLAVWKSCTCLIETLHLSSFNMERMFPSKFKIRENSLSQQLLEENMLFLGYFITVKMKKLSVGG